MKIKLKVPERIQLQTLLLKQGGMIDMELRSAIKDKIRFTPEEIQLFELSDLPDGRIIWNPQTAKEVEFTFTESEIKNIKSGINEKDQKKLITSNNYDLAKRLLKLGKDGNS